MVALYRFLFLALLPLALAGCASTSSATRSRMLTPVALPPQMAVVEPVPLPSAVTSIPATAPTPAAREFAPLVHPPAPAPSQVPTPPLADPTNLVATVISPAPPLLSGQPWPVAWTNVWVPFETWARMNHLGNPAQLAAGREAVFAVGTPAGMIRLKLGSQVVHLLGHDCLIAFPPRIVGGVAYLHSLDLQKTLQPLLTGSLELPITNRVIVIDAGHGGRDSGTKNAFGPENEKVYTLDWARRLEAILAANGWTVVLTRTNDIDLPLAERVSIADRARADVFLSLHFNSGAQHPEMSGLETYCLTPSGLPSTLRRGFDDDPQELHPNNAHDQANFLLANQLHRALLKVTGATDRGVRRARFMTVLRGQNRPAVLLEGGYLSNPSESRRIATPSYRQLLAEAVAQALNNPAPAVGPGSPSTASTASARNASSVPVANEQ